MPYLLYKEKKTATSFCLAYVKQIKAGNIVFTEYCPAARRFNLMQAVLLAFKYNLSWIHNRHTPKK